MRTNRQSGITLAMAAAGGLLLIGGAELRADPAGDFGLFDWNTTSPRFNTIVSPRDYLHQVSGYYFGDPG